MGAWPLISPIPETLINQYAHIYDGAFMIGILKKKGSLPKSAPPAAPPKQAPKESRPILPVPDDVPEVPAMDEFPEAEDLPPPPFGLQNDELQDLPPDPFAGETPAEQKMKRAFGFDSFSEPSSIKGPVFVSLDKYHEVNQMLRDLKRASAELHQIIADLKQNRDAGTILLEQSVDRLTAIEGRVEEITATLRAK